MNVVWLIIDALRPDHLSVNGYNRETSPVIDSLAKEGVTFTNAYCPLPRSDPSIASMLTGKFPFNHNVRLVWGNKMNAGTSTLTEILKSHGYRTAFMRSGGIPRDGSEKGFDSYDSLYYKILNKIKRGIFKATNPKNFIGVAEQRFGAAISWIKKNPKQKFFLMLHTNDLHWPYPVPKPFEHMFDPDYKGDHTFSDLDGGKVTRGELLFGVKKLPQEQIDHAIAHYDGGIRYIDSHIEKMIAMLKDKGVYDDTLILLTSDHGENFGEHNYFFLHGSSLYEPSLKSACILKLPGQFDKGQKIETRIQNIDLMPTILELLGIPLVDKIDGKSLVPMLKGEKPNHHDFIFVEGVETHFKENERIYIKGVKGKWRAIIKDEWKLIYVPHPEKDIFELYNLKEDPGELNNRVESDPGKAEELKKTLFDFMKSQSNEGDAKDEDLTEKSRKLLVKAGYLDD